MLKYCEQELEVELPPSYSAFIRANELTPCEECLFKVNAEIPKGLEPYVCDGYVAVNDIFGVEPHPDEIGTIMSRTRGLQRKSISSGGFSMLTRHGVPVAGLTLTAPANGDGSKSRGTNTTHH